MEAVVPSSRIPLRPSEQPESILKQLMHAELNNDAFKLNLRASLLPPAPSSGPLPRSTSVSRSPSPMCLSKSDKGRRNISSQLSELRLSGGQAPTSSNYPSPQSKGQKQRPLPSPPRDSEATTACFVTAHTSGPPSPVLVTKKKASAIPSSAIPSAPAPTSRSGTSTVGQASTTTALYVHNKGTSHLPAAPSVSRDSSQGGRTPPAATTRLSQNGLGAPHQLRSAGGSTQQSSQPGTASREASRAPDRSLPGWDAQSLDATLDIARTSLGLLDSQATNNTSQAGTQPPGTDHRASSAVTAATQTEPVASTANRKRVKSSQERSSDGTLMSRLRAVFCMSAP